MAGKRKDCAVVGSISETLVVLHLLRHGYDVFVGYHGNERIDLVALKNDTVLRIEVRTGRRSKHGNHRMIWPWGPKDREKHLDLLAIVIGDEIHWFNPGPTTEQDNPLPPPE